MNTRTHYFRPAYGLATFLLVGCAAPPAQQSTETAERTAIAAASMEDALVVDCQLPGKLQKLGGRRTYLTPGSLSRLSAVDCRTRGGEYTLGDLSSGTLSLDRWLPLAQNGEAEAQYYVARIYANGMSGVQTDYKQAADWYQKAANQGYASAQQELGYLYEKGLGVTQDTKVALDLQRKASGLGEELDYAWKIAATKDEAARQIAEVTAKVEASNTEVQTLRAQLQDTNRSLSRSQADLNKAQSAVLGLRTQLANTGGNPADAGKVKDLEAKLAQSQSELTAANARMDALAAESQRQHETLSSRLAVSQEATALLNEIISADKETTASLTARAAQAETRLNQSRQELTDLRAQYRRDIDQLTADRDALQNAGTLSVDQTKALVEVKERELQRQKQRVQALEAELANVKKTQSASATAKNDSAQRLSEIQARYSEQERQLTSLRNELTALTAKSQQDRSAAIRDLSAQLEARSTEVESRQLRLVSLESETNKLRNEVKRLQEQRTTEVKSANDKTAQMQQSLREAQFKLAEQRDQLDKLQTERATEMASLSTAQESLRKQLASSRQANASEMAVLKTELRTRETTIQAKQEQIAALEHQVQEQTKQLTSMYARTEPLLASNDATPNRSLAGAKLRSANSAKAPVADPIDMLRNLQGLPSFRNHALIIGNSNYRHLQSLDTPRNDTRDLAELLQERYGYDVTLLVDATAEEIMKALHEKTITLTESDNLLVYYAGHGDLDTAPERAYWLGVEANEDTRIGWLSAENIRAKIKQMKANHVLLVADSCFSGAITHPTTTTIGRSLTDTRLRVQWNRRARMVLTSGKVQPVVDRAGDPNHSFFAKYFLQILRQNNIVMSGEMLSYEISARMQAESAAAGPNGIDQSPTYSTLNDANHNFGDFFFVPSAAGSRIAAL